MTDASMHILHCLLIYLFFNLQCFCWFNLLKDSKCSSEAVELTQSLLLVVDATINNNRQQGIFFVGMAT